MPTAPKLESLLSARLFLSPQLAGEHIYFISDLSGRLSLYRMARTGSVPEPLLPRDLALMTPTLLGGEPFHVFPELGVVLVMIDSDGDERYQPCTVPLEGGEPSLLCGDRFAGMKVMLRKADSTLNRAIIEVEPMDDPQIETFVADVATGAVVSLGASLHGNRCGGADSAYRRFALVDEYTSGDAVLYVWEAGKGGRQLLLGTPLEDRVEGQVVPLTGFVKACFTPGEGLLLTSALFDDCYGLAYLKLREPGILRPVRISGQVHTAMGELEELDHLHGERYLVRYNIDGATWAYEGRFDETKLELALDRVVVGTGALSGGVAEALRYDEASDAYAVSFSTATLPVQVFVVAGEERAAHQVTQERVLGIPQSLLSPGEDASYTSHDGLRIPARLYLPAPAIDGKEPLPVIFYIHGGPQGQERPDFTWFSMPLIQFFTLNGFAVFVPNVRGSHGYGLNYTKQVDRDWGGQDRLDHVAAFAALRNDPRLDMQRVGVMGRSYGGYMTLMLAGRHPELWRAAVDMFGPFNLFSFLERIPESWKTYMYMAIGHPEKDRDRVLEMSPNTYLDALACPMLVIQGRNDSRVRAAESEDLARDLREQGKQVELLIFENEGHDVTKFENKVRCYSSIVSFFRQHLT